MQYKTFGFAALVILLVGCNMDGEKGKIHRKQAQPARWADSSAVIVVPVRQQYRPQTGQYCYVKSLSYKEDGTPCIEADYIRFLMGEAAIVAAREKNDEVTDGYYIVNDNPQVRTLPLASHFAFITVETNAKERSAIEFLQTAIKENWVLILTMDAKGEVVSIKEQFTP